MTISRLVRVPLRELWENEANGFTHWLAENLDLLGETLGFELSLVEQGAEGGPFSADILAQDTDGSYVIIENQLEQTDHDHLGKLITQISNLRAKKVIWITGSPRLEHEKAIHWLNETLPADTAFYMIRLEAYRIGGSGPAPLLHVVAGPDPEIKRLSLKKKELSERHTIRLEFWKGLLNLAVCNPPGSDNQSPDKGSWITFGVGRPGLSYSYIIRTDDAQIELYIDQGDIIANKQLFDSLYARREPIEKAFGDILEWHRLDGKRGCRIRYTLPETGLQDQGKWPELQKVLTESVANFQRVIQAEIATAVPLPPQ